MTPARPTRALIVHRKRAVIDALAAELHASDVEVRVTATAQEAEDVLRAWRPDVVASELVIQAPGTRDELAAIDMVRLCRRTDPHLDVIALVDDGPDGAGAAAIAAGAWDTVPVPVDAERLLDTLRRAARQRKLAAENEVLRQRLQGRYAVRTIIGRSPRMLELFDLIESVAGSEANILIQGENGAGKELVANALHYSSPRANGPFIKINCAAIPKELIEAELFGYRKGAFTGALLDKEGLLEMADGGSLLLDEIGEMPPFLQAKILRVLQEREYRPIGSDRLIRVDFRLITATNIDLAAALRDGRLREDLYFRINTITIRVPPLRERPEDIPLLCDHFLEKFRQRYQKPVKTIAPTVYHMLLRNRWAGNVRELENVIERGVLVAKGSEITAGDLPDTLRGEMPLAAELTIPAHRTLAEIEKMAIVQTLQRTKGNKQEAAQILGLYRPTLYSKMRKHGIADVGKAGRPSREPQ